MRATPSLAITAARACPGHQIARAEKVAASDWGNKDCNQKLHTAISGSRRRRREKQLWFWRGKSPHLRASKAIWAVLSERSQSSQSIFWSWSGSRGRGQCYSCRLWNKPQRWRVWKVDPHRSNVLCASGTVIYFSDTYFPIDKKCPPCRVNVILTVKSFILMVVLRHSIRNCWWHS